MVASKEALREAEKTRQLFKKGDDKRDEGLPLHPAGVKRIDNLSYGPDKKWHLLDLYLPETYEGTLPTIINIHGGAWVYGTKETYQFFGMSLVPHGFAFVNFNYRLPPAVEFPDELDDVHRVFHWVAEHAQEYHLNPDKVFVIGDSAGGQMALQYLTALTNPEFRSLFRYDVPRLTIRAAAINCCGSFIHEPEFRRGAPGAYFTEDAIKDKKELLYTEKYMTKDLPPLFLTTANEDFIRDCTVRLDGYLLAKQIFHEFHSYGDSDNPKGHVFNYDIRDTTAQICNQEIIAFFRRFMYEYPTNI